ncbi:hypothetical protein M0R45_007300 [Rubus argutus]|uniref:Uncharacterized protein n=1 Tax=Rubus argutus TaxID=59490 RepID=A0AAW1XYL8_RUBAR
MAESLQVIAIENVDMDGEVFEYILSHYMELQELSVTGGTTLNHIALVGCSIRLKSMMQDIHGVFDIPPVPNVDYMELKISVDDKNILLQMHVSWRHLHTCGS